MPTIIQRKCQITECHFVWDVNGKEGVNLLFYYIKHIVLQLVFCKSAWNSILQYRMCIQIRIIIILVFIFLIWKIKINCCSPKLIPFRVT